MFEHFFDAFLGALFGGVIIILVERLRSPEVKLTVGTTVPIPPQPQGPIKNNWRSLRINVSNKRLPGWADWWLTRLPAQQCQAEISFLRFDGTPFIRNPMIGRWASGSPEPRVAHIQTPNGVVPLLTNPGELKNTVDIYPGDIEQLDVAIRVDQEVDAYAWNNETYFFANWRNPNRQLSRDRYLVKVTVTSSGRKRTDFFRIDNDGPFASFDLAELTAAQRQVLGN